MILEGGIKLPTYTKYSKHILKRDRSCSTKNSVHLSIPCFLFLLESLTNGSFNKVISFVDRNWIQLFLLSMSLVSILVLSCVFPFLISQVNVYWWGKSQLRRRRIRKQTKKLNALLKGNCQYFDQGVQR